MAGFFPLFFKNFWNAGVPATESTFRLGLANGVASFIVALVAPLVGAIADKGREIFEHILKIASGERSKSEKLGYGDAEFVPWQIGATM